MSELKNNVEVNAIIILIFIYLLIPMCNVLLNAHIEHHKIEEIDIVE